MSKEPKKMGRPRLNDGKHQTYKLLPVHPEDHARIKEKAAQRGITMVELVNQIAKRLK